jgi:hypothetical protein
MWFTVELPQPAAVTEIQFESASSAGRGGRGGGAASVVGYPRGYTVQVSADGTTWGKPVVEGRGQGPRTLLSFAPVPSFQFPDWQL